LISAFSSAKVVASRNIYGAVNGIKFEAFILRGLAHKLGKGACVVMDNAKIYCGEMVKKFIEEAGVKLIDLSSYSPEFPP
jgi:transposase